MENTPRMSDEDFNKLQHKAKLDYAAIDKKDPTQVEKLSEHLAKFKHYYDEKSERSYDSINDLLVREITMEMDKELMAKMMNVAKGLGNV